MNWRDIAERAALTFVQAALAVVVAAGADFLDVNLWKAAALAGCAAVFSLIYNVVKQAATR